MCLYNIDERIGQLGNSKKRIGYKVFTCGLFGYHSPFVMRHRLFHKDYGWVQKQDPPHPWAFPNAKGPSRGGINFVLCAGSSGDCYPPGFHIFLYKKDAKKYLFQIATIQKERDKVVKVAYRGGVTFGYQELQGKRLAPVAVAEWMRLLE